MPLATCLHPPLYSHFIRKIDVKSDEWKREEINSTWCQVESMIKKIFFPFSPFRLFWALKINFKIDFQSLVFSIYVQWKPINSRWEHRRVFRDDWGKENLKIHWKCAVKFRNLISHPVKTFPDIYCFIASSVLFQILTRWLLYVEVEENSSELSKE